MSSRRRLSTAAVVVALLATGAAVVPPAAADTKSPSPTPPSGPAATPPLGWNTWNTFGCNISEQLIKQGADSMVSSGLKAAGYQYVIVDDCWMNPERDAAGNLQAAPDRFPSGMKALGDYIHSKGLKLGIYEVPTEKTCAQRADYPGATGSLGHEQQDATQFAAWGVDYLKYDWCSPDGDLDYQKQHFTLMRDALRATGRPIVYSINPNSGGHYPKTGATFNWSGIANLWRTTEDITAKWDTSHRNDWPMGVSNILDVNGEGTIADQSGPGHWNDPDMLEVGVAGELTPDESRTHFSLWALMAAPLLAGNDIRSMPPATRDLLTNPEVLAVDQDPLGLGGRKAVDKNGLQVWQKPLSDGSFAVVLVNRTGAPASVSTTAVAAGLPVASSYIARDLWAHRDGETTGTITAPLAPHASAMYRVRVATKSDKAAPLLAASIATPKYLRGGVPTDLTATFTNLGSRAVQAPSFSFTGPDGWPVQAGSGTAVKSLAGGESHQAVWRVTPPADASGTASFTAAITAQDTSGPLTASGAASVYVVKQPTGTPYVSDLPWLTSSNGWGPVERDTSNGESQAGDGHPITLNGVVHQKGIGGHANSSVLVYLGGGCHTFTSVVGVDDEIGDNGSVTFELWGDGRKLADSGVVRGTDPGKPLTADVSGTTELELRVTNAGDGFDYDHADWADATVACS